MTVRALNEHQTRCGQDTAYDLFHSDWKDFDVGDPDTLGDRLAEAAAAVRAQIVFKPQSCAWVVKSKVHAIASRTRNTFRVALPALSRPTWSATGRLDFS